MSQSEQLFRAAILPQSPVNHTQMPPEQLAAAYSRWEAAIREFSGLAQSMVAQFPEDRSARFFLGKVMQAAGSDDLALDQYEWLRQEAGPAELPGIRQAIEQCTADHHYFPPSFAKRFTIGEYATGHNAEVWRRYMRSDIQRGREIARTLRQLKPLRGQRVLDVGCGYGGMMIAMAEQGANVTGVEIDAERARLGRSRLEEVGIPCDYREADICDPAIRENLGLFDVITCQDVLEHVMDPTAMVQTICSMLRPGGLVFVQVPNKWGVRQLMADDHFGLTGLTALSRRQAIEYWHLATGVAVPHYDIGFPRGERYYMNAFSKSGVSLRHLQKYSNLSHLAWFAGDITAMCERLKKEIYPGLRPELQARMRRRIVKVLELYAAACELIKEWESSRPADAAEACDRIVHRLCTPLWRFVGVKDQG